MPLINSVLALLDGAFCLYYLVLSKSSNTAVSEVIATLSVGSRSGAHCGECSLGSGTPDWREASSLGLRPLCAAAPPARRPVRTARNLPMTSPLVSRPRFLAQGPCAKQPPSGGSTQGRCSQHPCLTSLQTSGSFGALAARASPLASRSIAVSTRLRASGLKVRTVRESLTCSGMMLATVPPWMLPTVITAGSIGLFSRDTIVCKPRIVRAAITMGSTVVWGAAACPPRPKIVISIVSAEARKRPE
jgi:hypothetical protein